MIKIGRHSFSLTTLSATVVAFCSAGIIGLSVYSYSREDCLCAGKEQVRMLLSAWSNVDRETTDLLIDSETAASNRHWQYSIEKFDKRLKDFTSSNLSIKLSAENRYFCRKADELKLLWPSTREKIEKSVSQLTNYIETHKTSNSGHMNGLLYQAGQLSAKDNLATQTAELTKIAEGFRDVMTSSRIRCTVLLEEINDIISDDIRDKTAQLRIIVFVLSMSIVVSMIIFIVQTQKESYTRQEELVNLVDSKEVELQAEKTRVEAAKAHTEQINRQLAATVNHANALSQQAMEAANSKNEFMACISHEIRTPMNAVLGFCEMLSEDNLTIIQKQHIGIIRSSSRHLLDLINDILDYSKIESGKMTLDLADCSIEELLSSIESMMRPDAIEQKIDFNIIKNEPLVPVINTDIGRLKQCLINLIGNAIKFTERGCVKLSISVSQKNGKDFITFEVTDTGTGISPDRLTQIFEPFAQSELSASRIYGGSGTGLGLAITKNLVEMMGGNINVKSIHGKGSTFIICVPTGVEACKTTPSKSIAPAPKATPAQISQAEMDKFNNIKLSGRILVAEDSPTNQTLIELLLRRMGVETVIVENGQLAVESAMAGGFDLVLMDMQMPVMNGYEAAKQLRKNEITIPIVALTACAMKGDDKKCLAAGCSDYLTKPVDKRKLAQVLAKYLTNKQQDTAAAPAIAKIETAPADNADFLTTDTMHNLEIDFNILVERVGDEALIDEIIPVFLKDNVGRMELLLQAINRNDINEIKFYAHSVKGATATIGAMNVSELAKKLENLTRNEGTVDYKPVFEELKTRFNNLIAFLAQSNWKELAKQNQA